MMSDDSFYNMMTDFSMYWMGFKSNTFYENRANYSSGSTQLSRDIVQNLPSLNAANSLAKGQDYFEGLFQEEGENYITSIYAPYYNDANNQNELENTLEGRSKLRAKVAEIKLNTIEQLKPLSTLPKKEFCEKASELLINRGYSMGEVRFSGFFDGNTDGDLSEKNRDTFRDWCEKSTFCRDIKP